MSAYIESINRAITLMVDFIYKIAHTNEFDDIDYSEIKKLAVTLLDVIEKEYYLANKKLDS